MNLFISHERTEMTSEHSHSKSKLSATKIIYTNIAILVDFFLLLLFYFCFSEQKETELVAILKQLTFGN